MHERSWTLILAPAIIIASLLSPSFAATVCNASLYGNPDPSDCSRLLFDDRRAGTRGLESLDLKAHFFSTSDWDKPPPDVTATEWRNRVYLAKKISKGDCSVFLAVGIDYNGWYQYDTGTYLTIARQANNAQRYCSYYPELGESIIDMAGGQGWTGDRRHILTITFSNISTFANMLADSELRGLLPDLRPIWARNPLVVSEPKPTCGRSHYCSKARDCKDPIGCICVADKWHGEYYTSKCKWPFPGEQNERGLLGIDSANATQLDLSINSTLIGEGTMDVACPCNCTYVSKACCESPSGILYEALDLRLGSVQAPSVNLTCNATTGEFEASNMTLDVMSTTGR